VVWRADVDDRLDDPCGFKLCTCPNDVWPKTYFC